MRYEVLLTEDAEQDLEHLYAYISKFDSPKNADHALERLFFKPYRVTYRVLDKKVVIYVMADGRRDMQSLLSRRLLGGL